MQMMTIFTVMCSSFLLSISPITSNTTLPKVFLLGEYEKEYEKLNEEYGTSLLMACDNDMERAFNKWISMLKEMEVYAQQVEYDINGAKFWLHVFWKSDGSISHIAYHLRPSSRNINTKELSTFLSGFASQYRFPLATSKKYSHYSTAYFPMTAQRIKKN